MKKLILLSLLIFSFLSETCFEDKTEATYSIQINILGDITNRHYLLPAAEPIQKLYDFETNKNAEGFFRITLITDKHLNPAIEYHLQPGSITEKDNVLDDPYYREALVLSFYDTIRNVISNFDEECHIDTSLNHSEVFSAIADELKLMKVKTAEKNVLLVFSDLQENSDLFNCYSKASQELLYKNPEKIAELFNATHLLPESLKNFTIIFIYQPTTRQSDQKFQAMKEIYQELLVPRGAIVKVQANNNYLN